MAPRSARSNDHAILSRVLKPSGQSTSHRHSGRCHVPNSNLANIAQIIDFDSDIVTQDDIDRADNVRLRVLWSNRKQAGMTIQQVNEVRSKVLGLSNNKDPSSSAASPESTISPVELHPAAYFHDMNKKTDLLWETSGRAPGHPGFGYKPDGTPTGSQYILYTRQRGYASLMNRDRNSPPGATQDKEVREELKRGGWADRADVLQPVSGTRAHKRQRLTLSDAKSYNANREAEELAKIQKKNVELDFE